MDTLCGIGLPELIIIALVGFVVIGPERSREIALTLGRWLRSLMTSPWWREFNEVAGALRNLPNTLVRMSELEDEVRQVRSDINQAVQIDLNQPGPRATSSATPEAPSDPWGIHNTVPRTATPPPTPPGDDEPHGP